MTKKIILFTAIFLSVLAHLPDQKIQSAINSNDPVLTITVYQQNGTSTLANAEVNIYSMSGILLQSGITRSDGKIFFSAKDLPEGKYKVRAYYFISAKEIHKNEIEIDFKGDNINSVLKLVKR
jgi:hypothetical protein